MISVKQELEPNLIYKKFFFLKNFFSLEIIRPGIDYHIKQLTNLLTETICQDMKTQ